MPGIKITIPPSVFDSPEVTAQDEFHAMQEALDRSRWIGTGCTKPFIKDKYASFDEGNEK